MGTHYSTMTALVVTDRQRQVYGKHAALGLGAWGYDTICDWLGRDGNTCEHIFLFEHCEQTDGWTDRRLIVRGLKQLVKLGRYRQADTLTDRRIGTLAANKDFTSISTVVLARKLSKHCLKCKRKKKRKDR